jgi:leader peptidase (prepilin peptidase)/N-methyltransferase
MAGPLTTIYWIFQAFAFAIGLSFGSFLNVCIARMPEDRSVSSPPSHCPNCGHQIRWYENIPVLSWVALGAKCSSCKTPISPLYPAIELLTGVLSLLLFRHLVPIDGVMQPDGTLIPQHLAGWVFYLAFLFLLLGTTFIDLRHYIIPDEFSIYSVPVGVAGCAFLGWLGSPAAPSWQQSVVGALIGGGSLWAVMFAYRVVRGEEGMGFGDVKLLAMMGAFLGALPAIPFIVLVSSVAGSVVGIVLIVTQGRGFRAQVPFGPFLSLAGVIYLFFGDVIIARWLPAFYLLPS